MFSCKSQNSNAVLRGQVVLEIVLAEIQDSEYAQVIRSNQQLADIFVINVQISEISVL